MIQEILQKTDTSEIIEALKNKTVIVPKWSDLVKEYDPSKHEIKTDQVTRKDKGNVKVARITYGMQRLATRRMAQMAFSTPVKRTYKHGNDPLKIEQSKALEMMYQKARIDALNKRRFRAYFGACEIATIWYVVDKPNNDYGFHSKYKLSAVTYSPMDERFSKMEQAKIYPLFDDYGDMIALSVEYRVKVSGKEITYFEAYTEDKKYSWKKESAEWEEVVDPANIIIGKIPGVYINRPEPIWEDQTNNIKEIEYTLSRQSDIIRRNTAPVMKVTGKLVVDTKAPESDTSREVYQFEEGGDVDYVKPPINHESVDSFVSTMKSNISEELQLPSLALNDIAGIGLTEESRKQLLVDAHLKVGEEEGDLIEFLSRECNVLKSYLALMNVGWKDSINELEVDHEIVPFVMNNDAAEVDILLKATAGEALMSQRTAIQRAGYVSSEEVDTEIERIREEKSLTANLDLFEPTF